MKTYRAVPRNKARMLKWKNDRPWFKAWERTKGNARVRGIAFRLSLPVFKGLVMKGCHYCGDSASLGLDRVNNRRGYVDSNVVPCCRWCNSAKLERSLSEFRAWALQLARRFEMEPVFKEKEKQ